jgi:hypothetical protein
LASGFNVSANSATKPHLLNGSAKGWKFNGALETDQAASGMFARKGVLNLDGLEGSGADWLERFKPYIQDGKTIVVAPHRVFGPETNDLVLQLRKRRISKVILGGMLSLPAHTEFEVTKRRDFKDRPFFVSIAGIVVSAIGSRPRRLASSSPSNYRHPGIDQLPHGSSSTSLSRT